MWSAITGISNTVVYLNSWVRPIYKAVRVLKAAEDIHKTYKDPQLSTWQKTCRYMGNGGLILGETINVTNSLNPNLISADPTIQPVITVGSDVVSGFGDVLATVSRKSSLRRPLTRCDYAEVVDVIFMRTIGGLQLGLQEEVLQPYLEGICESEDLKKGLETFATIRHIIYAVDQLNASPTFQRVGRIALTKLRRLTNRLEQFYRSWHPTNQSSNTNAPFPLKISKEDKKGIEKETGDLKDLCKNDHFILEYFKQDYIEDGYCICPLTKKPIRVVASVVNPHTSCSVFYEKEALLNWFRNNPNRCPINWPEGVLYVQGNIKGNLPGLQKGIDGFISAKREEIMKIFENLSNLPSDADQNSDLNNKKRKRDEPMRNIEMNGRTYSRVIKKPKSSEVLKR